MPGGWTFVFPLTGGGKNMKILLVLLSLTLLFPLQVLSQAEMHTSMAESIPIFYYDLVNVASNESGKSRLNLYLEIPFDELQFLKYDDYFKAEYEVSVIIFDNEGDQMDGKIWTEDVIVNNYDETNSRTLFSFTNNFFHLIPNEYRVSIGLIDLDTKKTGNRKSLLKLKDFYKEKLSVSDVTFTDNVGVDSLGVKSIHPQVSDCIRAIGTELFCYFEIYSQVDSDEMFEILYEIKNYNGQVVNKQEYSQQRDDKRTMTYVKIDKNKLSYGKYLIELKIKQGKYSDSVKKTFVVRWASAPSSIVDLKKAVQQLKYIAKQKDINEIKKAPQSEQIEKFEKFWEKRDPTPGTAKNELMDEYYRRITFSNENFSNFKEGWKTDMGMIYVIFGPPSDIERHPFDRGYKPYEIWYYYHINRQFIFIDETGFGDYRLRNPDWRNWQEGIYY